jgi:hypothetical protein
VNKKQTKAIILETARIIPSVLPYLSDKTKAALKADTPEQIQERYRAAVEAALLAYFLSGGMDELRIAIREAMQAAYTDSYDLGGAVDPEWLQKQMDNEAANIESLIANAQQMRDAGATQAEIDQWVTARALGYAGATLAIYNASSLLSKGDEVLKWNLGNTEKHCATCLELNGKSHSASWYLENSFIPRQPGANLDCGGWNCDCFLTDKSGNTVTL